MNVHVLDTGRLRGNARFFRGAGMRSLLRFPTPVEFPVLSYVVEHPEGLIAIDTGLNPGVRVSRLQRRVVPAPVASPAESLDAQLRARGLRAGDVRWVVITHLDWDHTGAIAAFPDAEVLVHRSELEFARTAFGRFRYRPRIWPADAELRPCDLDDGPYGPFAASRRLTGRDDVRLVPLAGHSIGQVGVVVEEGDRALLFCADHVLRQDWFVDELARGRLTGLGAFYPRAAADTTRRLARFARQVPAVLLPAHDDEAPARLADRAPVTLGGQPAAASSGREGVRSRRHAAA